jgi:hypothetical protein
MITTTMATMATVETARIIAAVFSVAPAPKTLEP